LTLLNEDNRLGQTVGLQQELVRRIAAHFAENGYDDFDLVLDTLFTKGNSQ
jgi:hypothetical protein